jgi:hypothetical protein
MTLTELFTDQGLQIQNSLRQAMRNYNRNASGKTSESIQFEVLETREKVLFQVVADKTIVTLQEGRGPTDKQGNGSLKNAIRQWVRDKGIKSDLPEETLVYLITRKIHREGYKGTPGLIDDIINESLIDLIQERVSEIAGSEFVNEIVWD